MTRKRGRARYTARRVGATLGKVVKAVVIIFPAAFTAYTWAQKVTGTGAKIVTGLTAFQMCYTGLAPAAWVGGSGADFSFKAELLAVGWGPPLIIGGIQYGLKAVHMQGANPFRVMSTLG